MAVWSFIGALTGGSACVPVEPPFPFQVRTVSGDKVARFDRPVSDATTWVNLLTTGGLTNVALFGIVVSGGSIEVRITTPGGTDQIISVSDYHVLGSSLLSAQPTAIAIRGVASRVQAILVGT